MTKTHRVVWMALAILFLVASKATAQGCAANGASLTHPGLPFVPGLPGHSIIIQGNLNLVGQANGTCPPPSSCTFTYQSNVTVDVSPAATPVAGELCLTQALGTSRSSAGLHLLVCSLPQVCRGSTRQVLVTSICRLVVARRLSGPCAFGAIGADSEALWCCLS